MELKPCPFCGGKDVKVDAIPSVAQFYRCERCKAKGPYWTAGEDAKEKWNTRATDLLLKEMAEALSQIVAEVKKYAYHIHRSNTWGHWC